MRVDPTGAPGPVDRNRRSSAATAGSGVRPAPLLGALVGLLPLWLAWLLVVVLGRLVCRLAQRIPPVVRLVRRMRAGTGGDVGPP